MQRICLKEPFFNLTLKGIKSQTRKIFSCFINTVGGLEIHTLIYGIKEVISKQISDSKE